MAGDIAVVFQQRLLQLTDVLLPYLARVAPVADGQRGSRARGLTADGAGTHDAGAVPYPHLTLPPKRIV